MHTEKHIIKNFCFKYEIMYIKYSLLPICNQIKSRKVHLYEIIRNYLTRGLVLESSSQQASL